jgi:hypothetical protein
MNTSERPQPSSQRESAQRARQRESLQRLARVLDSAIPLPGGFRIGLDGIVGLLPGVGDMLGALFSSFIVAQASRLGAPAPVILRMAGNIALDTLAGAVPVLGDLFDFAWKANLRNVQLLERHLAEPRKTHRRSTLLVTVVILALMALATGVMLVLAALLKWAWTTLSG